MSKPKNSKDALEFIHTLDSIAIKKQKEEIERLKSENERLRKAGDAMASSIQFNEEMEKDYDGETIIHPSVERWIAAKEGKQS